MGRQVDGEWGEGKEEEDELKLFKRATPWNNKKENIFRKYYYKLFMRIRYIYKYKLKKK